MIDRSLQHLTKTESFIIRLFGFFLIVAGIIHWFILIGFLSEKTPLLLTWYFDSLAFFDILAGVGMYLIRPWGLKIAFLIVITQIPAHFFMMYLDYFEGYQSGFSILGRMLDITLLGGGLLYARKFLQKSHTVKLQTR